MNYRLGDVIRHRPTGEIWVVLYANEVSGEVVPMGWPPTIARAVDCDLIRVATETEFRGWLKSLRDHQKISPDSMVQRALAIADPVQPWCEAL